MTHSENRPSKKVSHNIFHQKIAIVSISVTNRFFRVLNLVFKTSTRKGQKGHFLGHSYID
jgi:hypothetical protein